MLTNRIAEELDGRIDGVMPGEDPGSFCLRMRGKVLLFALAALRLPNGLAGAERRVGRRAPHRRIQSQREPMSLAPPDPLELTTKKRLVVIHSVVGLVRPTLGLASLI